MSAAIAWPEIGDEALVERIIPAVQKAIADASAIESGHPTTDGMIALSGPDVANALMFILASVLAANPAYETPRGTRLIGEVTGRELSRLLKEIRQLPRP